MVEDIFLLLTFLPPIYSNWDTLSRQVVEQGDGALLFFFLNYFKSTLYYYRTKTRKVVYDQSY